MKNIAIGTRYKQIVKTFPNTRTEILESFYKVWPWNKLKGYVFSVNRLKSYINFFNGMSLQVLYLSSNVALKTEDLEEVFFKSFFSILHFHSLGTMTQFPFKFRVGNKIWLKKLTEVSNYGKFISNIFGCDSVKIGIIRAKAHFSVWI